MIVGVVTPSYMRTKILRRFLRMMPRQSYRDWRLVVVHDGPNPAVESLVGQARALDSRIAYAHTEQRSNNYGVSPRAEGLRYMIREVGADYCVFWDDDNLFSKHALRRIVDALEQAGRPDVLLVPIRKDRQLLPRPGVSPDQLDWGELDTGSLVVRPELGLESYEHLLRNHPTESPMFYYTQDSRFFFHIRDEVPGVRIGVASCRPIGLHDGLRTTVYIRSLFGIPPLGLATRLVRRDLWSNSARA
jgi:glycosyltransferase involved in cell wall biosynthesis